MFQEIKQMLRIENVVEFYHEAPRRNKYICPFHGDKNPSMSINKSKQIFKCFTCKVGGDLITFTAKLFGLSNSDACKKLNDDFRLNIVSESLSQKQRIEAKRIKRRMSRQKQLLEDAYEDYMYWVEKFVNFDRICMDNIPKKNEEPSELLMVCFEMKEMCWDKFKESEVALWKLKNLPK